MRFVASIRSVRVSLPKSMRLKRCSVRWARCNRARSCQKLPCGPAKSKTASDPASGKKTAAGNWFVAVTRFADKHGLSRFYQPRQTHRSQNGREAEARVSQQLIRVDVDCDCDVLRHGQFVEGFANQPAQAHDRAAS